MKGSVKKSEYNPEVPTKIRSDKGIKVDTRCHHSHPQNRNSRVARVKTIGSQSKPQTGVRSVEPLGLRTASGVYTKRTGGFTIMDDFVMKESSVVVLSTMVANNGKRRNVCVREHVGWLVVRCHGVESGEQRRPCRWCVRVFIAKRRKRRLKNRQTDMQTDCIVFIRNIGDGRIAKCFIPDSSLNILDCPFVRRFQ